MADPQYSDLNREFNPDNTGDLKINTEAEAIKDSLINIFLTRKGERKHRPNFGASLIDLKHKLMDEDFGTKLMERVRDGFSQEPRAQLKDLEVELVEDRNTAKVRIFWTSPKLTQTQKIDLLIEQ